MTSSSPRSSSDTVLCLSYLPLPDEHRHGNSDIGGSGLTAHDETLGSELLNLDYELATFFGASESRARDDGPDEAHQHLLAPDGDGFERELCGGSDCNDSNVDVYPGAVESCSDNLDNNCDSAVNEGCSYSSVGGDICTGNETCQGSVLNSTDSGICCAIPCSLPYTEL